MSSGVHRVARRDPAPLPPCPCRPTRSLAAARRPRARPCPLSPSTGHRCSLSWGAASPCARPPLATRSLAVAVAPPGRGLGPASAHLRRPPHPPLSAEPPYPRPSPPAASPRLPPVLVTPRPLLPPVHFSAVRPRPTVSSSRPPVLGLEKRKVSQRVGRQNQNLCMKKQSRTSSSSIADRSPPSPALPQCCAGKTGRKTAGGEATNVGALTES